MDDLLQGFSQPRPMSVSDLNARVRLALEAEFETVNVKGEIGNYTRAASGHLYFNIKDEKSQVKCVMWRSRAQQLRFEPEVGMQVVVDGVLTVYEPRGEYQISVANMQPAGQGALQLAFEKLKARLQQEGLFDEGRKRPLPFLPRHVGIVTSPTGAAIRDIISVLQRRHPNLRVTISPALVQGKEAAAQIVDAIERLNRLDTVDVVVVTRGGGSIEDLWAFNEEKVARAIAACDVPVVSAVGHEIDFTIPDFVADLRAPTPSAAAEMLVGREEDLRYTVQNLRQRMAASLTGRIRQVRTQLELSRPERMGGLLTNRVRSMAQNMDYLQSGLQQKIQRQIADKHKALATTIASLDALSPLKALARGYSIVSRSKDGEQLRTINHAAVDDSISIRLSDGSLQAIVNEIRKDEEYE